MTLRTRLLCIATVALGLADTRSSAQVINEILADPPDGIAGDANGDGVRNPSQDEFVEIVNPHDHAIDLSYYRLEDATGTARHLFPLGTVLARRQAVVVFGGGNPDPSDGRFGDAIVQTASSGQLSLNNSGDTISLLPLFSSFPDDSYEYGSDEGEAAQSLVRHPELYGPFTLHSSTEATDSFSPGTPVAESVFPISVPYEHDTIQAAINASFAGDVVKVSPGVYNLANPIDTKGKAITVAGTRYGLTWASFVYAADNRSAARIDSGEGPDTVIKDLVLVGSDSGSTAPCIKVEYSDATITGCFISGGTSTLGGCISAQSAGDLNITDCYITGGHSSGGDQWHPDNPWGNGGGVYLWFSTATITDCTISDNTSTENGGGIYAHGGDLTVLRSTIEDNIAEVYGGGIHVKDGYVTTAQIIDCTISGNRTRRFGGGISCWYPDEIRIEGCVVTDNNATGPSVAGEPGLLGGGGGLEIFCHDAEITDCVISNNVTQKQGGGGLRVNGHADIAGCLIEDNVTHGGEGGGIYFDYGGSTVTDCRISSNSAVDGGAIFLETEEWGGISPVESIICSNSSSQLVRVDATDSCVTNGWLGCLPCTLDSDFDGAPDWNDDCPADPFKSEPGECGCGILDLDSDFDGTPNCHDDCPLDPDKVEPGTCGCGVADTDTDSDGTPDCNDDCPTDPDKTAPGTCGCGVADTDTDSDGTPDCNDPCPNWPHDCSEGGTIIVAPGQSIQQAIDASAEGGMIEIGSGTFPVSESIDTHGRNVTISGTPDSDGDGRPETVVRGDGTVSVFSITSGETGDLVLSHLAIDGGGGNYGGGIYISGSSPSLQHCLITNGVAIYGAGIYCANGSPVLEHCVFESNTADWTYDSARGAGMYCWGGNPVLSHCTFQGNRTGAEFGYGGGLYAQGTSPTLDHCTFEDNYARYSGGGLSVSGGTAMLTDCTFTGNESSWQGGALYNGGSSSTLVDCVFTDNTTQEEGGGVFNTGDGSPTFTRCTFSGNQSIFKGGGLYNDTWSSPTTLNDCTFDANFSTEGGGLYTGLCNPVIIDCRFTENTAINGGGIYARRDDMTVTNCSFSENSVSGSGGAIYHDGTCTQIISGCSFTGNTADYRGGAIYNDTHSTPNITDCIFGGNLASGYGGGAVYNTGSPFDLTDSILCANLPEAVDGNYDDLGNNCISLVCDSDSDGVLDCMDDCVNDPDKTEPGECGCGMSDADTDGDGLADCNDPCPDWPHDCSHDGTIITVTIEQSIQQAIDAAPSDGTIQLSAGTYTQGSIDPGGRAIVIRGAVGLSGTLLTTIDAEGVGSAVVFQSGESRGTQIRDLVITGGSATYGGGIECSNGSSPTITGCVITGNVATEYGGGLNCWAGSNPLVDSCTIHSNSATLAGGGLSIDQSAPTIVDCLIEANTAPLAGGIYAVESPEATMENTTVCGNAADPTVGTIDDLGGNCMATSCDDADDDGLVDECHPCVGDLNEDGMVDGGDLAYVLGYWGTDSMLADIDENGAVDGADLAFILGYWGDCEDH